MGYGTFDMKRPTWQRITFLSGKHRLTYRILPPPLEEGESYPLIIGLHGYTQERDGYMAPLYEDDVSFNETYPAFFLAPGNRDRDWREGAAWVRELAARMVETCPIDVNRIYIVSFSMGGSESYSFAEMLYAEEGLMTAAIVRCAGLRRPVLPEPFFSRTALWYNAGAEDDDPRVIDTFEEAAALYAEETGYPIIGKRDRIEWDGRSIERETRTLADRQSGREMYKFSICTSVKHEYKPYFQFGDVYDWLFSQGLAKGNED